MLVDALAASELEPGLEACVFLQFGRIQRPTAGTQGLICHPM